MKNELRVQRLLEVQLINIIDNDNIIHSYRVCVINADNKMITLPHTGRIIWINQIIKRTKNTADNNI